MADRNTAAQQKAEAEKKAAAQKKAEAEKKSAAQKKAASQQKNAGAANQVVPTTKERSVAQKKRDGRSELLKVSVYLDTGKVLGIASLGVVSAAILVAALAFIAG